MDRRRYIRDHGIHMFIAVGMLGVIEGILMMYHNTFTECVFVGAVFLVGAAGILIYDYCRSERFYSEFETCLGQLEEKYLIMEMMKCPSFLSGRILFDSLCEISKSMNDEIQKHIRISNEFKSYIEAWVHEIKLPIQALKLILYNNEAPASESSCVSRKLKEQIGRIDSYVEQVLYYIRSEVPQNDFVIARYSLKDIVHHAIKENRDTLILNHFSLEERIEDIHVFTDEKWLAFILGQVISNSVKYAKKDSRKLVFNTVWCDTHHIQLIVEDHGIGIDEKDVPRIFEKSFTGENGRHVSASTGMGLYLCWKMCSELGHSIQVETEKGRYTRILIGLKTVSSTE